MVQSIDSVLGRRRQGAGPNPEGRPSSGAAGRVPPHNLDAERSLLGAMLLSRDAIAAAMETCGADDFYKPAHAHVFEAINVLYNQGEPADPVTVADELARAGVLDSVGGLAALVAIQADTPATTSASRYARIVEEHALLRRLIAVAGEIAEMGYSVPDDVAQAMDLAESLVFNVAERRVTDTLKPLNELLYASMDRLAVLFDRGESITGVPTGYTDLDERLYGLQPNALVIVGARPAVGKALALDTPIPTPAGWKTMGTLAVGDELYDDRGRVCRVLYTSPVYRDHDCYRIRFDDGSEMVADGGHRWRAYDFNAWSSLLEGPAGGDGARVVTTEEMLAEGIETPGGRRNWYLPLAGSLEAPEVELPVDPYVLGCWLGAGLAATARDRAHFEGEFALRGYEGADLAAALRSAGVVEGAKKQLPAAYMRASAKQRLQLLQGLMDSDGTVEEPTGEVGFCSTNLELVEQTRELALSLGHKAGPVVGHPIRLGDGGVAGAWRFDWTPLDPVFLMDRKAKALAASLRGRDFGPPTRRAVASIERVPSVAVRCISVSSPSHLFLAGRQMVPTHNTAFALGMAAHAAVVARVPTLVFSLEMGCEEITNRLLVSEARVDAGRMRNGRLSEPDWPKISDAVARLGDAPLYIDDNPNTTVMEIRAKARRLKARAGGLGLIIIDYLQLMSGGSHSENRQLEVSSISRGLKILARELECPVVALSQLSRQLEARADKRPTLADLRESGCMPASTRLLRADNGEEVTLGELVLSQEQPLVWALDDETLKMVPSRLTKAFPSGVKATFRLRTRSGYEVEASANHRFRTVEGWRRLDELSPGDCLATPRSIAAPVAAQSIWTEDELVLLAHLLGDGSIGPNGVKYATADDANKEAVEGSARRLFGIEVAGKRQRNTWFLWLPSPHRLTHGRHHPVRNWLEPFGLWGSRSHNKFIPESVFREGDEKLALFLRHLWATDGSITLSRNGRGPVVRVYYATTSRTLADGVRRALLRLGIRSRVAPVRKDGYRICWHVMVTSGPDLTRFLGVVGCHGARGEKVGPALQLLATQKPNPNVDLIPNSIGTRVKASLVRSHLSHRALAAALGEDYCGSYLLGDGRRPRRFSRARLSRMAAVCQDVELAAIAHSDVFWDEIAEITPLGDQPTFDATVEGTHNFVANGIIAHNSLEQDADVVMFLYRDEIYNPDSADRGVAEVILAKHRNGPTGKVSLSFLEQYTKFVNMARV